jgi:4'-phosphopantetheinyl transferase
MADWACVPDTVWPEWDGNATTPAGEVHIWVASLDQPETCLAALTALLDPSEIARVTRYVRPVSRRQATVSRGLLRLLLAAYTGQKPESLLVLAGAHGKPFLAARDNPLGLRFNVSHSGARVLIAFASHLEVGIDIEATKRITHMAGVARRSFSPREFAIWQAACPADQIGLFFHFWSQKESVIKACGRGLLVPLDGFETPAAPTTAPIAVHLAVPDSPETAWFVRSLDPCPGYAAALCTAGQALPIRAIHVGGAAFERLSRRP